MALRIAFYGTGDRGEPFLRALARLSDVQLTAVCDIDRRSAELTAAGWGARVFLSHEAMLQETQPDALWIAVEPHLQGDVVLKAAELRVPMFIVPPGATDFVRARQYLRAIKEARIATSVGYLAHCTDLVREAREYIGANTVPLALGWWLSHNESPRATTTELLWNEACVQVDAFRFFCGDIGRVRALSSPMGGLVVQLEFTSGTVGVLTCASFARPEARIELELLGEGWSMVFGEELKSLRLAEHDKTTILRTLNNSVRDATIAFLDRVAGKPIKTLPDYADAVATMAVCQATVLSLQEFRPVELTEFEIC